MSAPFSFRLDGIDGAARTGLVQTAHGAIRTPAFMPVGTLGAVKAMHWREVRETGADMMTKYKETSRGGLAVNIVEC